MIDVRAGRADSSTVPTWVPVVVAVAATLLALLVKARCGIPAPSAGEYLGYCYSDIPPLYFVERLHEGAVPYLDHPVEYPVLTGLWMWLAALPASSAATFVLTTAPLLMGAAAVTAWLLTRAVGPTRALAFAAAPTLIASGAVNWDLPAVALATAGLVAHRRGRDGWSGILLGLGTAAKLFPGLFVPLAALAAHRLRGGAAARRTVIGAAGAWAVVNLPVLLAAPDGWWRFFRLSRERVSDWDALSTLVLRWTGWGASTPTLNAVLLVLFVAGYVVIHVLVWRYAPPERWHLAALPVLVWFLLTSKVYSPQFSLWLLPLLALTWPGWAAWAAFAVADVAVTLTRFPYLGNFVGDGIDGAWPWWPFATALTLRAVVLLVIVGRSWSIVTGASPTARAPTAHERVRPRG